MAHVDQMPSISDNGTRPLSFISDRSDPDAVAVSVRDIVERVGRTGVDTSMLSERIRHWTREGLLKPEGEDRPGTGRKRLYGADTVREAALLNKLAEMGIGIPPMRQAIDAYRSRVPRVDTALAAKYPDDYVLLYVNTDKKGKSQGVFVAGPNDARGLSLDVDIGDMIGGFANFLNGTDSTIILNLSRTFDGL